jgi:DNA-binding MarR family transcriptional regulator
MMRPHQPSSLNGRLEGTKSAGRAAATYPSIVSSASTARPVPTVGGRPGSSQPPANGAPSAAAPPEPAAPPIDVARLRVAIARLSRRLRKHELAGLTPTKLSALATVWQAGPVRLGDLAAAERIAPSTLTRLVSALEESGYVERRAVPGDARASTVAITPRGREVLERIKQESTVLLHASLLTLTEDQLAALVAALPALEQLAESIPGEPADR